MRFGRLANSRTVCLRAARLIRYSSKVIFMAQIYDASTKYLVDRYLDDWLTLTGRQVNAPVEIINSDLSAVTAMADRVLRVDAPHPWIEHIELQSSRDPDFLPNLHAYGALLRRVHKLPVRATAILLRPKADSDQMTGELLEQFPGEPPHLIFRYHIVRLWRIPAPTLLNGGLGLLPLAPLSDVAVDQLPGVIQTIEERVDQECRSPEEAGHFWTATDILMGLRYPRELCDDLLRGVHGMEDSVTYQAIVEKGEIKALRNALFELGNELFGPPAEGLELALKSIQDVNRLKTMVKQIIRVKRWEDLLAT